MHSSACAMLPHFTHAIHGVKQTAGVRVRQLSSATSRRVRASESASSLRCCQTSHHQQKAATASSSSSDCGAGRKHECCSCISMFLLFGILTCAPLGLAWPGLGCLLGFLFFWPVCVDWWRCGSWTRSQSPCLAPSPHSRVLFCAWLPGFVLAL